MDEKLRKYYLESQVKNAAPGQMLIMLYDGLIQQAERADSEISSPEISKDPSPASLATSRCIDIMTELNRSLNFNADPALCARLSSLYLFFTKEFSEAFNKREPKRIRDILPLIRDLRNSWFEADRRANRFQAVAA
jgi:flagellar protein FliS